jgi:integrase
LRQRGRSLHRSEVPHPCSTPPPSGFLARAEGWALVWQQPRGRHGDPQGTAEGLRDAECRRGRQAASPAPTALARVLHGGRLRRASKGECAGLRKADVDLEAGTLTIRASYGNATTKGGHADVIPIPPPLLPYIEVGLKTPGPFLFPAPDGSMRPAHRPMARILQPALGVTGLVSEYVHVCRTCKHKGVPHEEHHQDPAPRNCDTCSRRLWVKAVVRKLRFHDLRHSTATILLRAGVDAHRVQRILRHRDVRTTTGTYGHLSVEDLQSAVSTAWTPAVRATTEQVSEPNKAVANGEPANHPATFRQPDGGREGDENHRPAVPGVAR